MAEDLISPHQTSRPHGRRAPPSSLPPPYLVSDALREKEYGAAQDVQERIGGRGEEDHTAGGDGHVSLDEK